MQEVPVLVFSALPKQHQEQSATSGRTLHIADPRFTVADEISRKGGSK